MPGFMDMLRGGGGFTGGRMSTGFIPPDIGGGGIGAAPSFGGAPAAPKMNRKPGMGMGNALLPPNRRRGGTQGAVRSGQTPMARKMRGRGGMSMF